VPEYAAEGPGLLVDSVIEGTPAAAAGLLAGDRIVRIGDAKVKDVHGYMAALRDRQPGETLEVVVVRKVDDKSKEVTLKVTLK
jgi:S1-C subfamily serine protease